MLIHDTFGVKPYQKFQLGERFDPERMSVYIDENGFAWFTSGKPVDGFKLGLICENMSRIVREEVSV